MKTSHLVAAGVIVGALILIAKSRKGGVGDGDMLVPPPGRTLTASGQVLGALGLETRFIDSYDANPSQYNRSPQNDFVPGLGAFIKSSRPSPGAGRSAFGKLFGKSSADAKAKVEAETAKKAKEAAELRMAEVAQQKVNETLLAIQKRAEEEAAAAQGITVAPPVAEEEAGNGKWGIVMMQARNVGAIPYWVARKGAGTMTHDEATKAAFAKTAEAKKEKSAYQMPVNTDKHPASTYDQAKQAYDVVQAAREQESMSQASSDTGYGQTSNDTGYGATQQVTEEGAPQIPEQVSQVQTPSAQMLPQEAAPAAPSGNSKVGLIVGGGVLAAIAAAMAS
jgi:hypothetical protein